LADM